MAKKTIKLGRVVGSMIYTGPAGSIAAISAQLASDDVNVHENDIYISTTGNLYQFQGGDWGLLMNITGPAGNIVRSYGSVEEMHAAYDTDGVRIGGLVLIDTGNVEDVDNAKMFVKSNERYDYVTDLSGARGIKGETGGKGEKGEDGKTPDFVIEGGCLYSIFN